MTPALYLEQTGAPRAGGNGRGNGGRIELAGKGPRVALDNPDAVHHFLDLHDLRSRAEDAYQLARRRFPAIQSLSTQVRRDPEEDAAWLLITVETKAPQASADAAYRGYVRDWDRLCPPMQRGFVRLSYRVA